jgi:hypothetical protein
MVRNIDWSAQKTWIDVTSVAKEPRKTLPQMLASVQDILPPPALVRDALGASLEMRHQLEHAEAHESSTVNIVVQQILSLGLSAAAIEEIRNLLPGADIVVGAE